MYAYVQNHTNTFIMNSFCLSLKKSLYEVEAKLSFSTNFENYFLEGYSKEEKIADSCKITKKHPLWKNISLLHHTRM